MHNGVAIFETDNKHPWAGLLHPTCRHVWAAVLDERLHAWVGYDLRLTGVEVTVLAAADYDIAAHYRDQGIDVFPVIRKPAKPFGPLMLNNCVGMTKAVLGLDTFAPTPYKLRRWLQRQEDDTCFAIS